MIYHFYRKLSACAALAVISSIFMTGCVEKTNIKPTDDAALHKTLKAFDEICIQTAPSFTKAKTVAQNYGVQNFFPLGKGIIGNTDDKSLSVQIKPYIECAIGADTLGGKQVVTAFIDMVAKKTKANSTPMPTRTPFMASLQDRNYIFHLDRNGGDTLVMLDKGSFQKSLEN